MKISPLAGKPAEQNILINIPRLVTAYYTGKPDPAIASQKILSALPAIVVLHSKIRLTKIIYLP